MPGLVPKGPRGPFKGPRGPLKGPRGPLKGHLGVQNQRFARRAGLFSGWVPEGSLAQVFWARFSLDFRPNTAPGTPLDRRGPPRTLISTKNQPRRPILRPFRGTDKIPPDCLQAPSQGTRTWLFLLISGRCQVTSWTRVGSSGRGSRASAAWGGIVDEAHELSQRILALGGLIRGCRKYRFLGFLTRAPGRPEAPGRLPGALRGPSRGFRVPSGCTRELQETEAKNLEA